MRLILSASNHHPFGTCVKHFGMKGNVILFGMYEIAREWLLELLINYGDSIVVFRNPETLPERVMSFKLASLGRIILDDESTASSHGVVHVMIPFRTGPINRLNRLRNMIQRRGYDVDLDLLPAMLSLTDAHNGIFTDPEKIPLFDILRAYQLTLEGWGNPLQNLQMIHHPGLYPPHDFETINQLAEGFQDRYQLWELYRRIQEKVHLDHWTLPTDPDSPYKIFKDMVDRCRESPMADLMIMFRLAQLDEPH